MEIDLSDAASTSFKPHATVASTERALPAAYLLGATLLLALLVGALFGSAFHCALMPDDMDHIVMGRVANERGFTAANRLQAEDNVRPIPLLLYAADYRLFGTDPAGYRFSMALMHLVNALLVLVLAWRFSGSRELSLLAAALFVTHFAHWENAIWIGTLSDLMLAFFILTALLAYERFRRRGDRWAYAVALAATAGALLSKEAAVTVAPMIFVADLLIRPEPCAWRSGLVGSLRRTAPFFLLSFLLVALVLASGMVERYSASASLSLFGRHVPRHAAGYLAWMLFPFQTAGNVPGVSEDGWMGEAFVAVFHTARVVAVLGVGWLLWRGSTRQRLLCLWLLCAIAPYTIRTTMFPRYAYLATALFSVMVAGLAAGFLQRRPAHAWLLRSAAAVFVATGVFLVYFSPSVAAFKGYAHAAQPLIAQVRERREEMATASQLWLIDPPPFAPPGLHPRDRMWSQIAGAVRDGPIPTRTLSRTEWKLYLSREQVPQGVQAYWWHEGQLQRER